MHHLLWQHQMDGIWIKPYTTVIDFDALHRLYQWHLWISSAILAWVSNPWRPGCLPNVGISVQNASLEVLRLANHALLLPYLITLTGHQCASRNALPIKLQFLSYFHVPHCWTLSSILRLIGKLQHLPIECTNLWNWFNYIVEGRLFNLHNSCIPRFTDKKLSQLSVRDLVHNF